MDTQLKRKRILRKDDEAGRLALEKIGYVVVSRSKKGSYIMVLCEGVSPADVDTVDAMETTFGT